MKKLISLSAALVTMALGLTFSASALPFPTASLTAPHHYSSILSKIGKAVTYPVKKTAGNASKTANKTGQAAQYPVRKTGENASKTVHKAGVK